MHQVPDGTPATSVAPPRSGLRTHHFAQLLRSRAPGQLIIQFTDKCNASCPQCDMRMPSDFQRSVLLIDVARRSIDHAAANGVVALSITGGEPLLYLKEVTSLLRHACDAGIPLTRTGTNGFLFQNSGSAHFETRIARIAESLVQANVYTFWISIDSADAAVHERMRGLPGVVEGVRKALPIFHAHGLYPSVNLGINRNLAGPEAPLFERGEDMYAFFRDAFRRFYDQAIDLGFTIANACYPMSVPADDPSGLTAVYQATANTSVVDFTRAERAILYQALFDTVPEYRGRIRIFSPRVSLLSLIRQHSTGEDHTVSCRGGIDYFFVDAARGHAFPCGYRGMEDLGPYWKLELSKASAETPTCTKCDWECWRDPSALVELGRMAVRRPWSLVSRAISDREYVKTWLEDLRYISACSYFNCRSAPDCDRLARFARPTRSALR